MLRKQDSELVIEAPHLRLTQMSRDLQLIQLQRRKIHVSDVDFAITGKTMM